VTWLQRFPFAASLPVQPLSYLPSPEGVDITFRWEFNQGTKTAKIERCHGLPLLYLRLSGHCHFSVFFFNLALQLITQVDVPFSFRIGARRQTKRVEKTVELSSLYRRPLQRNPWAKLPVRSRVVARVVFQLLWRPGVMPKANLSPRHLLNERYNAQPYIPMNCKKLWGSHFNVVPMLLMLLLLLWFILCLPHVPLIGIGRCISGAHRSSWGFNGYKRQWQQYRNKCQLAGGVKAIGGAEFLCVAAAVPSTCWGATLASRRKHRQVTESSWLHGGLGALGA